MLCAFGQSARAWENAGFGLAHRGPDGRSRRSLGDCYMEFHRTQRDGPQPFETPRSMCMFKMHIDNKAELFSGSAKYKSVHEPLISTLETRGMVALAAGVEGDFAMCYTTGDQLMVARDRFGVQPLFYMRMPNGAVVFASEAKAFGPGCDAVATFPPGHVYDSVTDRFVCYEPNYWSQVGPCLARAEVSDFAAMMGAAFTEAVRRCTDKKTAYMLSGGLDSSLVVAEAVKLHGAKNVHTYSIGMADSPDCDAARRVAKHFGTVHTEVRFDVAHGLKVLPDVIRSIESYDTETVRSAVPMWILAEHVFKTKKHKLAVTADGADEIFGGFVNFRSAPSVNACVSECARQLGLIGQFSVLRAERCCAAHGGEVRFPFLNGGVVGAAMCGAVRDLKLNPDTEKWLLRQSFAAAAAVGSLPENILWRERLGMADGVGDEWVDALKAHAVETVTDETLFGVQLAAKGHNIPVTHEEALYRTIFGGMFSSPGIISEIWRPLWSNAQIDPSGRYLKLSRV